MNFDEKIATNTWDHISDVTTVIDRAVKPYGDPDRWTFARNTQCKYINVRIDMRDGGCLIQDETGKRISPEALAWQYSESSKERPK